MVSSTKKSSVKNPVAAPVSGTKKTTKRKKASSKKATKKVSSASKPSVRADAHPDKVFVLVDGKRVKNIKELADVMDDIEDYVFNHHVNENNNDFENWLTHVFNDIALARKIAGCKDKKHVQLVLYRHISHKLW